MPRRTPMRCLLLVLLSLLVPFTVVGSALATAGPAAAARSTEAVGAAAASAGKGRALWVWTRPAPRTLVSFALDRRVTDLYLSVPPDLAGSADLTWVRAVARAAQGTGLRLLALGGEPAWVDRPQAAVAWQTSALGTGLFAGSHVDVEPWVSPAWDADRAGTIAGYLQVLEALDAASAAPVEADVPFWLHEHTAADGTALDRAVMSRVDAVTVMSYRNTATGADSITAVGAHALASAAAVGIPARLAAETRFLGSDPVSLKQTFFGQPATRLESALAAVDAAMSGQAAYAGMAVHDHAGWVALPRR